jgi:hypothetical protein
MGKPEIKAAPEDGFIAEIAEILNSKTLPFDVTDLVKKYLTSSTLMKLNDAIRFCCSKNMSRPSIMATDGNKKYMLSNH